MKSSIIWGEPLHTETSPLIWFRYLIRIDQNWKETAEDTQDMLEIMPLSWL